MTVNRIKPERVGEECHPPSPEKLFDVVRVSLYHHPADAEGEIPFRQAPRECCSVPTEGTFTGTDVLRPIDNNGGIVGRPECGERPLQEDRRSERIVVLIVVMEIGIFHGTNPGCEPDSPNREWHRDEALKGKIMIF